MLVQLVPAEARDEREEPGVRGLVAFLNGFGGNQHAVAVWLDVRDDLLS